MSFEKTFNRIVSLKIASIILFFITFLCSIGAFVSWLYISNLTSKDFEITNDFELRLISKDDSGEDVVYNYNIKGSFISKTYSFDNGEMVFYLLRDEDNTSYSANSEEFLINESIEQGIEFDIDYNFSSNIHFSRCASIYFNSNESKFCLLTTMYGKMLLSLFLPLVIVAVLCFLTSLTLTIVYNILKKKTSNHVSNIQNTLTKIKNKPASDTIKCPYCNTKVNKNDKRCSGCGAAL